MSNNKTLYKVSFINQNKVYEVFATKVYQSDIYGFVVLEALVFDPKAELVVNPGEEKLRDEFSNVKRSFIPMHSVIRIDEVSKKGEARITEHSGNVMAFPGGAYRPDSQDKK